MNLHFLSHKMGWSNSAKTGNKEQQLWPECAEGTALALQLTLVQSWQCIQCPEHHEVKCRETGQRSGRGGTQKFVLHLWRTNRNMVKGGSEQRCCASRWKSISLPMEPNTERESRVCVYPFSLGPTDVISISPQSRLNFPFLSQNA